MEFAYFVVIAGYTKTEMAFVISQFVRLVTVFQPGQFQQETCLVVCQVNENERAVGCFLAVMFLQTQRFVIESNASFEVEDVYFEMIKSTFDFYTCFLYKLKISAFSGIGQQDITASLRFGIRAECYYFGGTLPKVHRD